MNSYKDFYSINIDDISNNNSLLVTDSKQLKIDYNNMLPQVIQDKIDINNVSMNIDNKTINELINIDFISDLSNKIGYIKNGETRNRFVRRCLFLFIIKLIKLLSSKK
jgi:hypothetical protein